MRGMRTGFMGGAMVKTITKNTHLHRRVSLNIGTV
jgi:hypothetical protein